MAFILNKTLVGNNNMHVSKINNRLKATRFQLTSWLSKTGESCKLQEEEELDICLKKTLLVVGLDTYMYKGGFLLQKRSLYTFPIGKNQGKLCSHLIFENN